MYILFNTKFSTWAHNGPYMGGGRAGGGGRAESAGLPAPVPRHANWLSPLTALSRNMHMECTNGLG